MVNMSNKYTYKIIEKEANAYKHKYPTYEKYLLKRQYYNNQAYKKRIKYITKLSKTYMYITIDCNGLYVPCLN
jgi:hypothetical protein